MDRRHLPFWLFAFSAIIALSVSVLVQDGMFMDAVLYSSVAHNESIGIGTFWFPQYSTLNIAGLSSFHEQPPLIFGIVSLFYRVFGESIYVERLYTFITMVITIWLIRALWRWTFRDDAGLKGYTWLVLVLWIAIPCVYWAYSNNMCENTMGIFALCSVLFTLRGMGNDSLSVPDLLLSGLFIFLATMSKGFPAFFPLGVPFVYYVIYRNHSFGQMVTATFLLLVAPAICYAILFSIPESRESLSIYLFKRALFRINNDPTVKYRLDVLYRIFCQLIPSLLIMTIVFVVARARKMNTAITHMRPALLFSAIGLLASVPLTLTLVQKDIYLIPCFPYLALGMAAFVVHLVHTWVGRVDIGSRLYRILLYGNVVALVGSIVLTIACVGKPNREKDMLHDVYALKKIVPRFSTVTVPPQMYDEYDFVLQGFLVRYDNISISPYRQYDYYLIDKAIKADAPPGYRKLDVGLVKYDIYTRL